MELIKDGLFWTVGAGTKIQICEDKQLTIPTSYTVQSSPIHFLDKEANVNELIDEATSNWNRSLAYQVLNRGEAQVICRLPLSRLGVEDKMVWMPLKDIRFSVKTTYRLEHLRLVQNKVNLRLHCMNRLNGNDSPTLYEQVEWKLLWKLKVPTSIKYFFRKAYHDLPPTRQNLYKRKIIERPLCPICERERETTIHAIWNCTAAGDIWGEAYSPLEEWSTSIVDFWDLWKSLTTNLKIEEIEPVASS